MHTQPELGQPTAWDVIQLSITWTIEAGWQARLVGRRNTEGHWHRARMGSVPSEILATELSEVLDLFGELEEPELF